MKLLLIDSDKPFAEQIHTALSDNPSCELVHVTDLPQAEDLVTYHDYDVILLGIPIPDVDMQQACERLAELAPHAPLIVLAQGYLPDEPDTLLQHIDDLVTRSDLTVESLLHRVNITLERRKRRDGDSIVSARNSHFSHSRLHSLAGAQTTSSALATVDTQPRTNAAEPLRVLQVDSDAGYSRLLENTLAGALQTKCNFKRVGRLADALKCLVADAFDVILLDPELADSRGMDTLKQIHPYAEPAPIIVLAKEEDEEQSLASMKYGADDCLFKSQLDTKALIQSIRFAVARKAIRTQVFDRERAKASVEDARQATVARPSERRSQPRYLLARPLVVIPVLPNGQPLEAYQAEGFTIDVSEGGIGFEIAGLERLPTRRLIIGMESDHGLMHYATIDVRASMSVQGGIRIGGKFSSADRDVLRSENFVPRVNHRTHRFDTGMPTETLYEWGELGICHPVLIDRIFVCPECRALPTLRHGCRACGSVHIASSQLIHHFACAHVDVVSAFECKGELVCPKCRARRLVIGSDFEYLAGPYQCLDCHWSDTELEFVGQCLACELRFPIEQAFEEEIIGYHVYRLDPLALISEP